MYVYTRGFPISGPKIDTKAPARVLFEKELAAHFHLASTSAVGPGKGMDGIRRRKIYTPEKIPIYAEGFFCVCCVVCVLCVHRIEWNIMVA